MRFKQATGCLFSILFFSSSHLDSMHMVYATESQIHFETYHQLNLLYEKLFWSEDYQKYIARKQLQILNLVATSVGHSIAQLSLQSLTQEEIASCKVYALMKNMWHYLHMAENHRGPLPECVLLLLKQIITNLNNHPMIKAFSKSNPLYQYLRDLSETRTGLLKQIHMIKNRDISLNEITEEEETITAIFYRHNFIGFNS